MPALRPVRVNLEELIIEMTAGDAFRGQLAYLDTRSGSIIYVSQDGGEISALADHHAPILRLEGREQYEIMTRFAAAESQPETASLLRFALHGKGAFRRFREVVESRRELGRRWRAYQAAAVRSRAVEWLRSIGIEPLEPTCTEPPLPARSTSDGPADRGARLELVDLLLFGAPERDLGLGTASRTIRTGSAQDARRVFAAVAAELSRLCEVPWAREQLADRSEFAVGRFSLRCEGESVVLVIADALSSESP